MDDKFEFPELSISNAVSIKRGLDYLLANTSSELEISLSGENKSDFDFLMVFSHELGSRLLNTLLDKIDSANTE